MMGLGSPERGRPPVEERREERRLFFWTAHETLRLVLFVTLTVYVVVSVAGGQLPGSELLRYVQP